MQEEWRDVVGYEYYFKISNLGNLYSKRTDRILKQTLLSTNYYSAATKIGGRNGKDICFRIHRLVAEAFLEKPTEYQIEEASKTKYNKVYVNHKDGNKLNNHIENLEWCTAKENFQHALDNKLFIPKEKIEHIRKLSYKDALDIRSSYVENSRSYGQRALARLYGVNKSTIKNIVEYKTYIIE